MALKWEVTTYPLLSFKTARRHAKQANQNAGSLTIRSGQSGMNPYETLKVEHFEAVLDAAEAMIRFTMVMNKSNHLHFKKTKPITEKHGEQSRPWWDKECNRPVKQHPKSA